MKKKILLLTLVHPDFLPPVYAVAQTLRDLEFDICILTFESFVPAKLDLGPGIEIETLGRHYDAKVLERLQQRKKFIKRANELVSEKPVAIISFCPFSFKCGLQVKKKTPLIYIALEIADFSFSTFLRSPLSNYRNLTVIKNIAKADLIATPSVQRSAWLAGRCHLDVMPYTILNTSYVPAEEENPDYNLFKELVPAGFLDKKIILYTGAVNKELCIMELVQAFDIADDTTSALIITGVKNDKYCEDIKQFAANCKSGARIKLFPYLTRAQMLSLQSNAHIGSCLMRESQHNIESKMMAPNKVGEYMKKKLYILGVDAEYLRQFQMMGFASLARSYASQDVSDAIREALAAVNEDSYKSRISDYVHNFFCMQQQLKPVVKYINEAVSLS